DKNNKNFVDTGNCLIDVKEKNLISGCNNSVIPADGSVEHIGSGAFFGLDYIKTITVPASVKSIDMFSFCECKSLEKVLILSKDTLISTVAPIASDNTIIYCYEESKVEQLLSEFQYQYKYIEQQSGDINGDGVISDQDAIYLLFSYYFPDKYPVDQPCDFNKDGEVTDQDAIYLLFHYYFPDKYPIE
ncbi:MAG: leucine-rich repeat protein, partial [Clostridia bacterium]|nr:leucine-rich repeat protein [Clostridia bacterium]